MKGYVKVYRKLLDSDIWYDVTTFRLFLYLILNATHKDGIKVDGIELKKGQYIRSYRKIAEDLAYKEGRGLKKYSIHTIKKSIDKLVKTQRIAVQETEVGTLFTIVNYSIYQDSEVSENESGNGTGNELGTNWERTRNKNKNEKNDKNEEENNNIRSRYRFETCHMKLAELLFKKMKENNPNVKKPSLESWANTFRLMMERDHRSGKDIQDLILWSQKHPFWYKNILSADKLRKQFDRLKLEMMDEKKFKVINGGRKDAIGETSYSRKYAGFDFSKRNDL